MEDIRIFRPNYVMVIVVMYLSFCIRLLVITNNDKNEEEKTINKNITNHNAYENIFF